MPQISYQALFAACYPALAKVQKPGGIVVQSAVGAGDVPNKSPSWAPAAIQNWVDYWKLGATQPSIVLDFTNNRYYDGISNAATLASMVQNTGTVDNTGLQFTGANNVNCIGAFLTALQQAAVTVGVEVSNAAQGLAQGILAFGSGNPDAPILLDDSSAGYFNSWNGTGLTSNYQDSVAINTTARCASSWNNVSRSIIYDNTGNVNTAGATFTQPVTSAKLGNYGANALPYTGKIKNLAVYPVKASADLMNALSWRGAWRLSPYGITLRGVSMKSTSSLTPGVKLNYERIQPWTMTLGYYLNTSSLNGTANVIFTDVPVGPPWSGFECYVLPNGKPRIRIMSGWDGTSANNRIEVDGNTNVCDAHNILCVTYDGSSVASGVKIYLNGTPMATTTNVDNLTGTIVTNQNFQIGYQNSGTGPYLEFGDLMMTFIFDNVVRSAAYIAAAAASEVAPTVDANTQLYYDFRENTGNTTIDHSANSFIGTFNGAQTWLSLT
jgi:hypothetical protein